jgi:hypothetical protein
MKRLTLIGLLLIASFAFTIAVASASQAADPIVLVCSSVKETGLWNNQDCSNDSPTRTGNWEKLSLLPSQPTALHNLGGPAIIESATGEVVSCGQESLVGEIISQDSGELVATFTACKAHKAGEIEECAVNSTNAEPESGEIITNTLKGLLGLVAKTESTSGVGLLVEPARGAVFTTIAESHCTIEAATEGTVTGEVSPVNTISLSGQLAFIGSKGTQKIKAILILGKTVKTQLKAFGLVNASISDRGEDRLAAAIEIM